MVPSFWQITRNHHTPEMVLTMVGILRTLNSSPSCSPSRKFPKFHFTKWQSTSIKPLFSTSTLFSQNKIKLDYEMRICYQTPSLSQNHYISSSSSFYQMVEKIQLWSCLKSFFKSYQNSRSPNPMKQISNTISIHYQQERFEKISWNNVTSIRQWQWRRCTTSSQIISTTAIHIITSTSGLSFSTGLPK